MLPVIINALTTVQTINDSAKTNDKMPTLRKNKKSLQANHTQDSSNNGQQSNDRKNNSL